jgi:Uma2 family endonuclease
MTPLDKSTKESLNLTMGHPQETRRYTLAEYLALEELAEYKSEFYNGEIFSMAGGSPEHSRIAANCMYAMMGAFEEKGCQVFESNLMIKIEKLNVVLYPDASVFCAPLERDAAFSTLVKNPTLILEVLSKGTAKQDRGSKFIKYQMIPSLQSYVLVEQNEPRVYVAHKSTLGAWEFSDYFGLEEVVDLKPLGVSIPMKQIYKWLEF